MNIEQCYCYTDDNLNYIVYKKSQTPNGIFIVHVGGSSKRKLFRMMQLLFQTEFLDQEVYFHTQSESYWKNHSVLDGYFGDMPVYRYINKYKHKGE